MSQVFLRRQSSSALISSLGSDSSLLLVLGVLINSSHVSGIFVSLNRVDFNLPSAYV